jgi:4,5:9,10-diseco-3-hydroxy-5,9,17-trioxoandrosta-1(10),2-diene-4-oate hydrolase
MVRFFAAGSRRAVWFPRAFAAYYRTVLQRSAAAAQRARIVASAYEIAPVLRDAWVSFGAPDADLRDLVPTIQCPTLFAWGVRDVAVQLRRSLPAISRFPNVRVERFAAGHAAHLETPDELVAAVRRFVGAQKL